MPGLMAAIPAAAILCLAGTALAIDGRIVQIGFRMSGTATDLTDESAGMQRYREGSWVPILVELFNEETAPLFEGKLRVMQADRDGDLAVTAEPVAVRGLRRYWLYTVASPQRGDSLFAVQLLDAEGNITRIRDSFSGKESDRLVPSPFNLPRKLGSEDVVVLDISDRQVTALYRLTSSVRRSDEDAAPLLSRPVAIARSSARNLPPHRCGLDMVNVVVWDAPDPAALPDAAHQVKALAEWVYHGGVLVLGVGRTWQNVEKSALAPLLPGPLTGTQDVQTLPEMEDSLRSPSADGPQRQDASLTSTITICPLDAAALRPGTRVLYPAGRPGPRILACRRLVGRGQVVYVGAELRDLYARSSDNDDLTIRLLGLRRGSKDDEPRPGADVELFAALSGLVGFEIEAGLYFLFAVVFVVCYILLTTLVAWQWLKARGWSHHSWTAFAAMAVVASLLSLGAVRLIRGIGYEAQELNVVDLHANDYQGQRRIEAQTTSFYGLKTGSHERLDILLPPDWTAIDEAADTPCTLRVLPPGPNAGQDYFVASDSYEIVPTRGRLLNVPFRATLKQFEGSWRGEIGGGITASLTCVRDESNHYRFDGNAWIRNDLGVDLHGCLLLQAEADPDQRPLRRWAAQIRAIQIGDPPERGILRRDATLTRLDTLAYGPQNRRDFSPTLADLQTRWAEKFGVRLKRGYDLEERPAKVTADISEAALLLLTSFQEFKPAADPVWGSRSLARTGLSGLDLSNLITKDTALLVGFSDSAGPARLCYRPAGSRRNFRAIRPSASLTLYRVLIPIKIKD